MSPQQVSKASGLFPELIINPAPINRRLPAHLMSIIRIKEE